MRLVLTGIACLSMIAQASAGPPIIWRDCFVRDCAALKDMAQIDFGYLPVPEDHSRPDGKQIRLAFAVLRAKQEVSAADPILYLSGGPGVGAIQDIAKWEDHFLREDRDIILVDFRGMGYSEPELCPELNGYMWSLFAGNYLSPDQERQTKSGWFQDCFRRLQAAGLDLNQYRSAAVIQDLELLRKQLGYEQWNLLSVSYGTRTAQTYLRDAPQPLRAVILDSTFPLGYFMDHPLQGYLRSLTSFFAACENDPSCQERFPDLWPRFYEVMNGLKTHPILLRDPLYPEGRFYVNLQDIHLMFFQFLKNRSNYPALPYLIEAVAQQNTEVFHNMMTLAEGQNGRVSMAAGMLVNKNDNYYPPIKTMMSEKDPLKYALTYFDGEYDVFNSMDFITFDSLERRPVQSDVPVLILAGALDPATPSIYGERVHEGLENSQYFEFSGLGHGVSRAGGCIPQLLRQFLESPELLLSTNCRDQMSAAPITFVGNLYENAKVATLIREAALEKRWLVCLPIGLLVLSWIVSMLQWWRRERQAPVRRNRLYLSHLLTATLGIVILGSTGWLVYRTTTISQLLLLMGLVGSAHYVYYLSYLFLAATVVTAIYSLQGWEDQPNLRSKLFSVLSVLGLIGFGWLIILFDLFP